MFVSVIIAAAGQSSRMGSDISKQLLKISGKTVLEYSLDAFSKSEHVKEIIVSSKADEVEIVNLLCKKYSKFKCVVEGGSIRQESVKKAIAMISDDSQIVAIHDAARPLISTNEINEIISCADKYGAVCPVSKVADTVKKVSNNVITETLDRSVLFLASTPQTFKTSIYKDALKNIKDGQIFTDDCSIVENYGKKVYTYVMEKDNTKITTVADLDAISHKLENHCMRVGHGYDVHRLVNERDLILGGVKIPHDTGLLGHSDADVLVHAIMDAILGAASLGDIGKHFPDNDNEFAGISSIVLLERVKRLICDNGFKIQNIDATVIAQAPKLSPYIPQMRVNIAKALEIDVTQVNIKATTEEGLGFTGEKIGISAHSVALLTK